MKKALTGNGAVAYLMRQINPDVVAAYPITPSTQIMEDFSQYHADGLVKTDLVLVESEHSALSACVGASAAGGRAMTATSSAGLAFMWEILSVASGLRLPIVMNIVNRALSSPINIHCDHSDAMGARDSGWIQIYSEDAQEVYVNNLIALKLAEKVKLPVMVCQDGFITSHCVIGVDVLEDKEVKNFVGNYEPKESLLHSDFTLGSLALPDYCFEIKKQISDAMEKVLQEYLKVDNEVNGLLKHANGFFEEYKVRDAEKVIVCLSSTAGVVKEVVDELRSDGKKVGLLKIRLFRPFPYKAVAKVLEDKKVIVMDRSISYGSEAPLYSEIKSCAKDVKSIIYGLGGRHIHEDDIKKLFVSKLDDKTFVGVRE